jgi:hypothetical protein
MNVTQTRQRMQSQMLYVCDFIYTVMPSSSSMQSKIETGNRRQWFKCLYYKKFNLTSAAYDSPEGFVLMKRDRFCTGQYSIREVDARQTAGLLCHADKRLVVFPNFA